MSELAARKHAFELHQDLVKEGLREDIPERQFFRVPTSAVSYWSQGPKRQYILDSGASHHCVSKDDLTEEEAATIKELPEPIEIYTAKGPYKVLQQAKINVVDLGLTVWAILLQDSPP